MNNTLLKIFLLLFLCKNVNSQTVSLGFDGGIPPHYRSCDTAINYKYLLSYNYSGYTIGDTIYFKASCPNCIGETSFLIAQSGLNSGVFNASCKFKTFGNFDVTVTALDN